MLIICHSIYKKEVKSLEKFFSKKRIVNEARLVKGGIRHRMSGWNEPDTILYKTEITGKNIHGRIAFLFYIKQEVFVLAALRAKKDKKIGENMILENQNFKNLMQENLILIKNDLKNEEFQEFKI